MKRLLLTLLTLPVFSSPALSAEFDYKLNYSDIIDFDSSDERLALKRQGCSVWSKTLDEKSRIPVQDFYKKYDWDGFCKDGMAHGEGYLIRDDAYTIFKEKRTFVLGHRLKVERLQTESRSKNEKVAPQNNVLITDRNCTLHGLNDKDEVEFKANKTSVMLGCGGYFVNLLKSDGFLGSSFTLRIRSASGEVNQQEFSNAGEALNAWNRETGEVIRTLRADLRAKETKLNKLKADLRQDIAATLFEERSKRIFSKFGITLKPMDDDPQMGAELKF